MTILDKIVERKQQEVRLAKEQRPLQTLSTPDTLPLDFEKALRSQSPAIIAEIKKASPSKGVICENFNPVEIAKAYQQSGATCLSVLTDEHFFQGHNQYLIDIKNAIDLPILRKDFIIDTYQIIEARSLGADCVLLIAAILDDKQLQDFTQVAHELGMAVLVESHTQQELERALDLPTNLIGINNRDLKKFKTNLNTTLELKKLIPTSKLIITESGINTIKDIQLMQSNGINTFLIGEALMRLSGNNISQLLSPRPN